MVEHHQLEGKIELTAIYTFATSEAFYYYIIEYISVNRPGS